MLSAPARLRQLVRVALEQSSWHRRRLDGVNADDLDEEALRELPVMTKDDLMDNFDAIVTDPEVRLEAVEQTHRRTRHGCLLRR